MTGPRWIVEAEARGPVMGKDRPIVDVDVDVDVDVVVAVDMIASVMVWFRILMLRWMSVFEIS